MSEDNKKDFQGNPFCDPSEELEDVMKSYTEGLKKSIGIKIDSHLIGTAITSPHFPPEIKPVELNLINPDPATAYYLQLECNVNKLNSEVEYLKTEISKLKIELQTLKNNKED